MAVKKFIPGRGDDQPESMQIYRDTWKILSIAAKLLLASCFEFVHLFQYSVTFHPFSCLCILFTKIFSAVELQNDK